MPLPIPSRIARSCCGVDVPFLDAEPLALNLDGGFRHVAADEGADGLLDTAQGRLAFHGFSGAV